MQQSLTRAPAFLESIGITSSDIASILYGRPLSMSREQYETALMKSPVKHVGQGHYAHVFSLPSGAVLKVTTDPDDAQAAELVRRAISKGEKPPGLPYIEHVKRLPDPDPHIDPEYGRGPRTLYAIVVDYVTPLHAEESAGLKKWLRWMASEDIWTIDESLKRGNYKLDEPPVFADRQIVAKLDQAMRGVKWLRERGFEVNDLHLGNFGETQDGEGVLIDFGDYSRQAERVPRKVPIRVASNPKLVGFGPGGALEAAAGLAMNPLLRPRDDMAHNGRRPTEAQVREVWRAIGSPRVDMDELRMGIEVEQEHTSDLREAGKIAMDHLREFPDYYTRLTKMEARAKAGLAPNGRRSMPKVHRSFDRHFDEAENMFPDIGTIELHEDDAAGSDNGAGSERQFGYCADENPIRIAFAPKTEKLPQAYVDGLMAHEFGHAIEFRYGVPHLEDLWGKLPKSIERRADRIAWHVFGVPIQYGKGDIQCIGCGGKATRPRRLG